MSGSITIHGKGADNATNLLDKGKKEVIFKVLHHLLTAFHVNDIDVMMPMHNLIEHSDNYSKTSRSLWQSYRNEPTPSIVDS